VGDAARTKGRMAIYSMAGVYLIYLAYCMFRDCMDSTGAEFIAVIVTMILFGIIGAGLIIFSMYKLNKIRKEEIEQSRKEEDSPEEE
jgi:prolipoprotein diacylglyceryltransferase